MMTKAVDADINLNDTQLVKKYKKLIFKIMNRYKIPFGFDDDLFQEAMIGMLQARKRFNPNKGTKLSTYLYQSIDFAIRNALNRKFDLIRITPKVRQALQKRLAGKEDELSATYKQRAEMAEAISFVPYCTSELETNSDFSTTTIDEVEQRIDNALLVKVLDKQIGEYSLNGYLVKLHYLEGFSIGQLSKMYELSENAIRRRINRGVRLLRNRMLRNGNRLQ